MDVTDKNIRLVFNHTEPREIIQVIDSDANSAANLSYVPSMVESAWEAGNFVHYNDTSVQELTMVVNG